MVLKCLTRSVLARTFAAGWLAVCSADAYGEHQPAPYTPEFIKHHSKGSTAPCPPGQIAPVPGYPTLPPVIPMPTPPTDPGAQPADPTAPAPATPEAPVPQDAFASAPEGGTQAAASAAPNMFGDLLRAYRGVQFSYLQAGDFAVTNTSGTVNFRNTKIAENNIAIPRDRIGFRYNFFNNSLQLGGLQTAGGAPELVFQGEGRTSIPVNRVAPATRDFDVHLYTLQLEKTFLDGWMSLEYRLPFASTVSSDLNLISGENVFTDGRFDEAPIIRPTPGRTLGDTDSNIQDSQLIWKVMLAQDCRKRWTLSSGLGLAIPTGQDLNVRVVDYSNDVVGDPGEGPLEEGFFVDDAGQVSYGIGKPIPGPANFFSVRQVLRNEFAIDERTRTFTVKNDTWGLAPFLALFATPTPNLFFHGFWQIDVPLNKSDWIYREREVDLDFEFDPDFGRVGNGVTYDNTLTGSVRDQVTMHFDFGAGYWLYKNRSARILNGLAGLLELHYTTTLSDADIQVVRATQLRTRVLDRGPDGTILPTNPVGGRTTDPESQPLIGNFNGRQDFLNMTVGSTMVLWDRATLGGAFSFPLLDGDNRTFDWEFQVQLNLYFDRQNGAYFAPSY